jgi:hypothetical protein
MAIGQEGQTTSRLGSQSVFSSVQEVRVASDGDLEKRVGGFRRGQVAASGRRSKDVRQKRVAEKRDWHTFSDGNRNSRRKKEGSCLEETFGRRW